MNTQNTNWISLIVVLVVLVLLVLPLLFMAPMMGWAMVGTGMMGGYGPAAGGNGWGWLVMLGVMLLLFAGLAALAAWALRRMGPAGASAASPNDPLVILKQRYARGEIDREQYEQMKRDVAGP